MFSCGLISLEQNICIIITFFERNLTFNELTLQVSDSVISVFLLSNFEKQSFMYNVENYCLLTC